MIITANKYLNMTWQQYNDSVVMPMLAKYGLKPEITDEGKLTAEVNHGRWIVRCECGGAEKMFEEGVFMCQACFNAAYKHKYRRAVFPKSRKQIENLLLKRPLPNRNWSVGETIEDLKRENDEHKEELL